MRLVLLAYLAEHNPETNAELVNNFKRIDEENEDDKEISQPQKHINRSVDLCIFVCFCG